MFADVCGYQDRQIGSAAGDSGLRPLGEHHTGSEIGVRFPATSGDGHYQGTKGVWRKAARRAGLTGVTPHSLRHTMGSVAISTGEALAMTGVLAAT
jgi:integrase